MTTKKRNRVKLIPMKVRHPACPKTKASTTSGPCVLRAGHKGDCRVKPIPKPPMFPYPAPIHVEAPDGDVRDMIGRLTRIQLEIAGFGEEAIRVRDQHRVTIDNFNLDEAAKYIEETVARASMDPKLRLRGVEILERWGRR